ncbi:MAG TPA: MFS transporter [Chitinophagales bacterium]|nr:MFS transporter [Chitinophagales bacterium]
MRRVLPVIVISQFFCISLWFAGNAIMPELLKHFHLPTDFLSYLTSAVQLGFITGTLVIAVFTISDRFSPSHVFFISSILAGLANLGMTIENVNPAGLLFFRFLTGFFLGGIYPVGMKIASDYYRGGLGKALGFLVGALVVGTAFPHILKSITSNLPWKYVIISTSVLSSIGGLAMLMLVPNGPYRKPGQQLNPGAFIKGFSTANFRSVAFGYFGHMWELYTFWAFVPVMLATYQSNHPEAALNIPLLSFLIIGCGGPACVFSGLLSQSLGAKKVAVISLCLSGLCCLSSPLFLFSASLPLFTGFLFFWGLVVIADSPLFSTLVAQNASEETRGSALTIVNCIGFSITIVSIQLLNALSGIFNSRYVYMVLAIGPVLGLLALLNYNEMSRRSSE